MENRQPGSRRKPVDRKKTNAGFSSGKQNKPSTLANQSFVKKAISTDIKKYESDIQINDFPIHPTIKTNLFNKGYSKPTEIQEKTFDSILQGKDLLGIAQTGTGKTAAFLVPLVQQFIGAKAASQIMIIVPTRELA